MVDFTLSRLKHQARHLRLRLFLDGKSNIIASDSESPRDCTLGRWIYSEGLKKYEEIPEVQRLEEVHMEVHNGIKHIIELKNNGQLSQAEQEFARLEPSSKELLSLLTMVEDKVAVMKN